MTMTKAVRLTGHQAELLLGLASADRPRPFLNGSGETEDVVALTRLYSRGLVTKPTRRRDADYDGIDAELTTAGRTEAHRRMVASGQAVTTAESATSSGASSNWIDGMGDEAAAIREDNEDRAAADRRAADADLYGDPTDEDDLAAEDAASSDPDTDMAEDEAITTLMLAISAKAAALGLERREGRRAGTVAALREIASLTDEALAGGGARPAETAPAGGWTLWNAPNGSRALGPVEPGAPVDGGEWVALGVDAMWALISPLDVASKGVTRSAEWLAECGGRLTLLPVAHAPAVAPEPADDSPAGRQASALKAGAELALALPGAEMDIEALASYGGTLKVWFRKYVPSDSGEQAAADGERADLAGLLALLPLLADVKIHASAMATGQIHISARNCRYGAVPMEVLTILESPAVQVEARAWLAELGVEVSA